MSCEIERYQPIFGLSDVEVEMLKRYMADFAVLRQCCGFHMSKYEVLRLNGCNVTKYMDRPDYPHCEDRNIIAVEHSFASNPLPFHPISPELNWVQPGDCDRLNAQIATGMSFNGRPFQTCDIVGKFSGFDVAKDRKRTLKIKRTKRLKEVQAEPPPTVLPPSSQFVR